MTADPSRPVGARPVFRGGGLHAGGASPYRGRRLRGAAGAGWCYGMASLHRRLHQRDPGGGPRPGHDGALLLTLARDDLLASWKRSVPPDAPNRFVINIQPEQREPVRALFAGKGLEQPALLPMVRGRLVAVNGRPVVAADYEEERAQRLVEREFNLSWVSDLPEGNSLTAGRWFAARDAGTPQFSVEQGLADTLKLKLDDLLVYEIAGRRLEARITSLRKLDWDSMRVNFFVVTPPGVLEPFPTSYITSFHLPADRAGFVGELVAAHPNLTVIDVAFHPAPVPVVMTSWRRCSSSSPDRRLAVLYAALESTHDEREYDAVAHSARVTASCAPRWRRSCRPRRDCRRGGRHHRLSSLAGLAVCLPDVHELAWLVLPTVPAAFPASPPGWPALRAPCAPRPCRACAHWHKRLVTNITKGIGKPKSRCYTRP